MPYPTAGEPEQHYVSRFMASPEAQASFPDQKQRLAVAYSMHKQHAMAHHMRSGHSVTAAHMGPHTVSASGTAG